MALNFLTDIDITDGGDSFYTGMSTTKTNFTTLDTEIHNARGGEANLDTRLDGIDTTVSANTTAAAAASTKALLAGMPKRPQFTYKDADEIYISAGSYYHEGTTTQTVYWDSQLTYTFSTIVNADWSHLYIDDSAVVTAGTNLLTATEFIDSVTAPSWSQTKHGWYNGNDLCIFSVYGSGANTMVVFWHDGGDLVTFDERIATITSTAQPAAFADIGTAITAPDYCTKALCTFVTIYSSGSGYFYYRTNGSSATNGHEIGYAAAGVTYTLNTTPVYMDTSQLIEVKGVATNNYAMSTNGWFFPKGM